MRILIWHIHGGWMDAFVRGGHEYLLPVNAARDRWGLGRGGRDWPDSAREVREDALRDEHVDLVVLQRPDELDRVAELLGRAPGRDLPAVYLEHDTPKAQPVTQRHPLADRDDIPLVHVTHFNRLVWDNGRAPTRVIEHGIPDPGQRYSGWLPSLAVVINEPVRRWRVTGTDLLPRFAAVTPLDVFGMGTDGLAEVLGVPPELVRTGGDMPGPRLHREMAVRRAYLHPFRWTSLGLTLLEAMAIGMPVLALATTETSRAVPREAGVVSNDPEELVAAAVRLMADADEARAMGEAGRRHVLEHYGLERFLADWDAVLEERLAEATTTAIR